MNFRKSIKTSLGLLSFCLLFSFSSGYTAEYSMKMASLAPKHIGWAQHMITLIHPAVDKATNGELKLKWYWGGVMGDDKGYIEKMKMGQLDGAAFSGQGVILACPEMAVLGLPFLFNDYAEVDYIRDKMRATFDKYAEKHGYKMIVWSDQDFDQIYSSKYRMDKIEDFKKAKIVTWYGPLEQKVLINLGASPVPVNVTEITPSVRQGVADTLIAPSIWVIGAQLYPVFKNVNPVKIRYSPAGVFVTMKTFNSIPPEYQKSILEIRDKEAIEFRERVRQDNEKGYKAMLKGGMQEIKMNPDMLKKMEEQTKSVWTEMAGKDFPKELLDEVIANLKEYRSKKK